MDCQVSGRGSTPAGRRWSGRRGPTTGWAACEVDTDDTGGLNKPGDVVLHVPDGHETSIIARQRARLAALPAARGRGRPADLHATRPSVSIRPPSPSAAPRRPVHAEVVRSEDIGRSDGTPASGSGCSGTRCCRPRRRPCSPCWTGTTSRLDRGEHLRRLRGRRPDFHVDAFAGEVQFAPAVRSPPVKWSATAPCRPPARACGSRCTGPAAAGGNVARGQIRVLKTSVPYVARVENRGPAVGGAEAEDLEDAKLRGPMLLRSRGPGGHGGGLRGAGQAGRAGDRPGALRGRGRAARRGTRTCGAAPGQ